MKYLPLKKLLLFFAIFLIAGSTKAYTSDTTNTHNNSWAITGKILPWTVLVLPFWGINGTVGAEYDFAKVHAIGFNVVYNNIGTHNEYSKSNGGDSAGPNTNTITKGLFLYYKRYINFKESLLYRPLHKLNGGDFQPYWSAFGRYGTMYEHFDMGFATKCVTYNEWQYSAGLLIGEITSVFDINMGFFYKQSYVADVEKEATGNVLYTHMRPSIGFRIGLNLFITMKWDSGHLIVQ